MVNEFPISKFLNFETALCASWDKQNEQWIVGAPFSMLGREFIGKEKRKVILG